VFSYGQKTVILQDFGGWLAALFEKDPILWHSQGNK